MGRATGRLALLCCVVAGCGTAAADSLTIEVDNLRSAQGSVLISLCADRTAQFPGACRTRNAMARAGEGRVTLRIQDLPAGTYALQAFHDENGNNRPEIPPEGYAFGNDAAWPPGFDSASVKVEGEARTRIRMAYQNGGETGAEAPAGVTRIDLRDDGLYGAFYFPADARPAPALLLVGGSEGGLDTMSRIATSFARAGFATLALAYWRAPGLPQTLESVPLEYFDRAIAWLESRPQVAPGGVGMFGWSRGSEAALLTAIHNPSVRAVVGVAPSSVVWQGLNFDASRPAQPAWTRDGRPLPALEPDISSYRFDQPMARLFTASFPALDARPDAVLPVEKIRGGVLLISGGQDSMWPAMRFADRIGARLQAEGFQGDYRHLHYPEAGHVVFVGDPADPAARGLGAPNPMMGGSNAGNEAAWRDNWPRTIEFLHAHLEAAGR